MMGFYYFTKPLAYMSLACLVFSVGSWGGPTPARCAWRLSPCTRVPCVHVPRAGDMRALAGERQQGLEAELEALRAYKLERHAGRFCKKNIISEGTSRASLSYLTAHTS